MNFGEKKLYHQIHPAKLATDIGVTPIALYFLWQHAAWPAVLVAFIPPILVSYVFLTRGPDLTRQKDSALGRYIKIYMTPWIEAIRFLTLLPIGYGAWAHDGWWILLGFAILIAAWCNGLIWRDRKADHRE